MKKTKAISITLPINLAEQLEKTSREEGRPVSYIVSEAVKKYGIFNRMEKYREEFSERARKLGIVTEDDINRIIHEYRAEEKAKKNSR